MDGISSFRRCKMSLPSPLQFHIVLALSTTEDPKRPWLLASLAWFSLQMFVEISALHLAR